MHPAEVVAGHSAMAYIRKLEGRCRAHRLRRLRWFAAGFLAGAVVAGVVGTALSLWQL